MLIFTPICWNIWGGARPRAEV